MMISPGLVDILSRLMLVDAASAQALEDVAAERLRQIEGERCSVENDDRYEDGVLAAAGASYALAWHTPKGSRHPAPSGWPWPAEGWKPKSKYSNCVRACALIVAESARYLRGTR